MSLERPLPPHAQPPIPLPHLLPLQQTIYSQAGNNSQQFPPLCEGSVCGGSRIRCGHRQPTLPTPPHHCCIRCRRAEAEIAGNCSLHVSKSFAAKGSKCGSGIGGCAWGGSGASSDEFLHKKTPQKLRKEKSNSGIAFSYQVKNYFEISQYFATFDKIVCGQGCRMNQAVGERRG